MDMSFMNHKDLAGMDEEKVKIMMELAIKTKGKDLKETAPLLMEASQKMKEKNLTFTPQESSTLFQMLTKDMSAGDRAKVEMMKKVLKKQGGL